MSGEGILLPPFVIGVGGGGVKKPKTVHRKGVRGGVNLVSQRAHMAKEEKRKEWMVDEFADGFDV